MEAIRINRTIIGLLAVLLAGLYIATVTVDPVFATNVDGRLKPKTYDKGIKIDKGKKDNSDQIKIKSHPILKSPQSTITGSALSVITAVRA